MHPNQRLLRSFAAMIISLAAALLVASAPAGAVQYQITRITNNNNYNNVYILPSKSLNNAGQLVWIEETVNQYIIFFRDSNGNIQQIASYPLYHTSVEEVSINDRGQIAWGFRSYGGGLDVFQIYLKDQNKPEQLIAQFNFNVDSDVFWLKLNNLGQIIWKEGTAIKFYNKDSTITIADKFVKDVDLNNKGQVAWTSSFVPYGPIAIYIYYEGAVSQIPLSDFIDDLSINDQGQIVTIKGNELCLYDPKSGNTPKIISSPPNGYYLNYKLNNNGQIVWTHFISGGLPELYLYDPSSNTNPQALLHSAFTGVQINDIGQIFWVDTNTPAPPVMGIYLSNPGDRNNPQKITDLYLGGYSINNSGQIGYVGVLGPGIFTTPQDIYLATPQVEVAKKVYGIFIGSEIDRPGENFDFRPDKAAELIAFKFTNLPNYVESVPLTKKMAEGGNKKSDVQAAIDYIKPKLKPGDGLVFYVHCHGAPIGFDLFPTGYALAIGSPTISSIFDYNTVAFNPNDFLTDSDLHTMLDSMDNIQKWVFIDACHSGGFYNSIHTLKNACLVASAEADKDAHYTSWGDSREGRGLFSYALDEGFSRKENGKLNVDSDENGTVTFDEILKYIQKYNLEKYVVQETIVYELDFGNPTIFTLDKWNPTGFRTADFVGGLAATRKATIAPLQLLLLD